MFALAKSVAPAALDRVDGIRIGNLIEALFGLLNQAAGDPDLEDGDLDRGTAGEDGPIAEARLDPLGRTQRDRHRLSKSSLAE
ncbi:hypothetical protein U1707_07955 [Sphingomonas sp. PB2P12]|uniref:hypothetical protein n=1 Tax=Sphingomonas sandaracina TaxID=3096157 RepID=UPI002FC78EFC